MRNFPITDQNSGKEYWISRSMAVCANLVVYDYLSNDYYLLANKRGAGTPDFQHCWNIPCGYLDWDETTSDACTREVLEECKVYINPCLWEQWREIEDSIDANKQNVTIRKFAIISMSEYNTAKKIALEKSGINDGETNEVDDIRLIPLNAYDINKYKWAFNHYHLAFDIMYDVDNKYRSIGTPLSSY